MKRPSVVNNAHSSTGGQSICAGLVGSDNRKRPAAGRRERRLREVVAHGLRLVMKALDGGGALFAVGRLPRGHVARPQAQQADADRRQHRDEACRRLGVLRVAQREHLAPMGVLIEQLHTRMVTTSARTLRGLVMSALASTSPSLGAGWLPASLVRRE